LKNSKGTVWYGLHFYPGVAEYREPGKEPYRVFLNENTIRSMDPTFAGRPVFVRHVDEVAIKVDDLKHEADGWVIESFFNAADGKHWAKFITVSEKADRAIKNGARLSNCYVPKNFAKGGMWNGLDYTKEVTGAEYEHLAIVDDPRYEESVILSPEQFKKYCEDKELELKRLANAKGNGSMKLNFFKRAKVENSTDLDGMMVVLPNSKKEVSLEQLITDADKAEAEKGKARLANAIDLVKVGDEEMTVKALLEERKAMNAKMEKLEAKDCMNDKMDGDDNEDDEEQEEEVEKEEHKKEKKNKKKNDDEFTSDGVKKAMTKNDDEYEGADEPAQITGTNKKNKKKNEADEEESADELEAKRKAKEKADRLRNARDRQPEEISRIDFSEDQVSRGKTRYGS
jgi:hypothetical protein